MTTVEKIENSEDGKRKPRTSRDILANLPPQPEKAKIYDKTHTQSELKATIDALFELERFQIRTQEQHDEILDAVGAILKSVLSGQAVAESKPKDSRKEPGPWGDVRLASAQGKLLKIFEMSDKDLAKLNDIALLEAFMLIDRTSPENAKNLLAKHGIRVGHIPKVETEKGPNKKEENKKKRLDQIKAWRDSDPLGTIGTIAAPILEDEDEGDAEENHATSQPKVETKKRTRLKKAS